MFHLPPILLAGLTGFGFGFFVSIPVGPVNLSIVNEGARRGFKWAALIGAGATSMEVIYCLIAFASVGSFIWNEYVKAAMELISFLFLIFLGIKFLLTKSVNTSVPLGPAADKFEAEIKGRLHPHSAFMTGFVQVLGNVGVLAFWLVCAASFISHDWVANDWEGKLICVAGVALGTGLWFFTLSAGAARGYGRISEKTLLRMEHFSGICLLLLACVHGGRIIWQLSLHRH
jgi:threonine/homoserine/homoserine lactone efflux protein